MADGDKSGGRFAFRPSKLSTFGQKIDQDWKSEKKPGEEEESGNVAAIPSIFGGKKTDEKHQNGKTSREEKGKSSGGFVFGSKIQDRISGEEKEKTAGPDASDTAGSSQSESATPPSSGGTGDSQDGFKNLAEKVGTANDFSEKLEPEKAKDEGKGDPEGEPPGEEAGKIGAEKKQPIAEKVDVKTGEEDERNVFHAPCKLFAFLAEEKKWAERGKGDIRINDSLSSGERRIVMRVQGSLRVVLNAKLWSGMVLERLSPKRIKISAPDPDTGVVHLYLLQAGETDSKHIESLIKQNLDSLPPKDSSSERKRKEPFEPGVDEGTPSKRSD